jgi:hypothetical protein
MEALFVDNKGIIIGIDRLKSQHPGVSFPRTGPSDSWLDMMGIHRISNPEKPKAPDGFVPVIGGVESVSDDRGGGVVYSVIWDFIPNPVVDKPENPALTDPVDDARRDAQDIMKGIDNILDRLAQVEQGVERLFIKIEESPALKMLLDGLKPGQGDGRMGGTDH